MAGRSTAGVALLAILLGGCDGKTSSKDARFPMCVSTRFIVVSWRELDGFTRIACPGHLIVRHAADDGLLLECQCRETPKGFSLHTDF